MFEPLLAAITVSLLSLTGVVLFGQRGALTGTNRFIIPIAIGVFLGVVFFELIPETLAVAGEIGSLPMVLGFVGFYLLSQFLHTYHHHHGDQADGCEEKAGASMLLVGDAIHNLADGIVIASAFLINPAVGAATTIGVALHEIPQEIMEFAVLLRAGYSKFQAALYNLASASSVIVGAALTLLLAEVFAQYIWILTGLAAGNLLYIAASDLLPGVHAKSRASGQVISSVIAMLVGLLGIVMLLGWTHEEFGHGHESHEQSLEHHHEHEDEDHHDEAIVETSQSETEATHHQEHGQHKHDTEDHHESTHHHDEEADSH